MNIPIPKGTFDILPQYPDPKDLWRHSDLWAHIESVIRQITSDYGFKEIRTPVFERTELFTRGIGETSDIVTKEMYTFLDKGNRSMTLRPEGTAPVMRAFLEKKLHISSPITKFFYVSPMFRYERQQAGRYRQHHQFGVEAIGNNSPEQDVEVIDLLYNLYNRLGIKNLTLHINSVGNASSREKFRSVLQNALRPHLAELSDDSKIRFEKNPLRILDSKDPSDKKFLASVPSILEYLDEECRDNFETVCSLLKAIRIPFTTNAHLVRGLDYYNKTVFEITANELGAQNSIGGGGRYDGLIKSLGGPDLPAIGFGTGIERVIQTMLGQDIEFPAPPCPKLFIIPLGSAARERCFCELQRLRRLNIAAEMDFSGKKLKNAMRYANTINAEYCTVIGDTEIESGKLELKHMNSGETRTTTFEELTKDIIDD